MESNNILDDIEELCSFEKISLKDKINDYEKTQILINLCKTFEGHIVELYSIFMGKKIKICNCNVIGDILEDIFFPIIKDVLPDFEKGPKQASPDYYACNKKYEFEQKVFLKNPSFDIGNFTSYIEQLCKDNGVFKKIFMTKYLIFEYSISIDNEIIIKKFHYLNVYNLVSFKGKYPISMQNKKNIWYNIRPDSVKNWYLFEKTPKLFINNIIECIKLCPHIDNKDAKIKCISEQFIEIQSKYTF